MVWKSIYYYLIALVTGYFYYLYFGVFVPLLAKVKNLISRI